MARKDLHEKPFDASTIAKLEIFQAYAGVWIPTFVMQQHVSNICIFDFFAGTGYDKNKVAGSPIRLFDEINNQIDNIIKQKVNVKVYLNEFDPKKFEQLNKACSEYFENKRELNRAIDVKIYNKDFKELFAEVVESIKKFPSLVYLDQNGIKFINYIYELEKLKQTDFLFFVSSSYFRRFANEPEFKNYLDINWSLAKKEPYEFIHRIIIEHLRKRLPANSELKLYPFSLKKGSNIHGIIFGASYPRAVEKFLHIAWNKNQINGEANFDLYDDISSNQIDIFNEPKLKKIEKFHENVRKNIFGKQIINNFELYNFALEQGHLGSHAANCLKEMKKNGEVSFEGVSPLVTYDNVYKKKKKIEYQILKNETQ